MLLPSVFRLIVLLLTPDRPIP
jgi:hypothetical protein